MKKLLTLLILGLFIATSAFAAVGVKVKNTDGTSSGPFQVTDFSFNTPSTVSIQSFDGSTLTLDNSFYLTTLVNIAASADTLSTTAAYNGANSAVTPAKTGAMYVVVPTATNDTLVLSLPGTYSTTITGLTYTFAVASGKTLAVRTASATDSIIYYGVANTTKITSAASSGSTVTLVGQQGSPGAWYVKNMASGSDKGNTWTAA
jgi:hypothetical protein